MKNKVHNLILFWGFVFLFLLLIPATSKAACANVPMSGDYTVSSSCTFANPVDGVDEGGITINAGVTLTINAGQTIVWSPGHSIVINGAIAIADGAQLKQTYLWLIDADDDGYPDSMLQYAQDTPPANGKRRSSTDFTTKWDYTSQMACGGGYYLNGYDCVEVGPGYYSPENDNTRYECGGNNYYCPTNTNTAPTPVSVGFYSTGGTPTTRTGQAECEAGYYCVDGVKTCCPAGTYQPDTGQTSCLAASPGHYVSTTCATSQTCCPANTYQPSSGQTSCISCGACKTSGTCATACSNAPNTNWGANLYNCTGSNKRCYGGVCRTCGGKLYPDNCGGCAGQGSVACWYMTSTYESCAERCASHGGCVNADINDNTSCSVCKMWYPSASCTYYNGGSAPYYDGTWCRYRINADWGGCNNTTNVRLFCVCNY